MIQYLIHIAILLLHRIGAAQSLNLYWGYLGMYSFSHLAFYGIGCYAGAILLKQGHGWGLAFLVAALVAAPLSALLAVTSAKLRADYLGIVTFGFSQIVLALMYNFGDLTGGARGLAAIPRTDIFGINIQSNGAYLIFTLIITSILMGVVYKIVKSPAGRVLEAIHDDQEAARSLGIPVFRWKVAIFTIGSTLAAILGVIYGSYLSFIHPVEFSVDVIAMGVVILMLGGQGTFRGPIIGATIITGILEALRFIDLPPTALGPLRLMIYSAIFLAVLRFVPQGIGGAWKSGNLKSKVFTKY